ncbi:MAG: FKBP-type peptidyl-prolyl cis-trans isomerase [Hymenobacteraceae bacterium]|nr:FKBP-type peptidyl-prolyl cis-trans isomerase [Hymenobacteraceae bacterium]
MNLTIKSKALSGLLAKALLFFVIMVSFAACKEQEFQSPYYQTPEQREEQKKIDEETIRKYFRANNVDTTAVQRTNSGLYHLTLEAGNGDLVKAGQRAEVHYIGWTVNGYKFDSSYERGQSFSFVVGAGSVIKGWDEGLQLMRVGETAKLFIPSYLGYGFYGSNSIPPNSVLIFEIKVLGAR